MLSKRDLYLLTDALAFSRGTLEPLYGRDAVHRVHRLLTRVRNDMAVYEPVHIVTESDVADLERFEHTLEAIANQEWVENCLDPQWAARQAKVALNG